jgi:hypothetical protein
MLGHHPKERYTQYFPPFLHRHLVSENTLQPVTEQKHADNPIFQEAEYIKTEAIAIFFTLKTKSPIKE